MYIAAGRDVQSGLRVTVLVDNGVGKLHCFAVVAL